MGRLSTTSDMQLSYTDETVLASTRMNARFDSLSQYSLG